MCYDQQARDVWTTKIAKERESHESLSCFSCCFVCFVVQDLMLRATRQVLLRCRPAEGANISGLCHTVGIIPAFAGVENGKLGSIAGIRSRDVGQRFTVYEG
jgi:hypothetical protein